MREINVTIGTNTMARSTKSSLTTVLAMASVLALGCGDGLDGSGLGESSPELGPSTDDGTGSTSVASGSAEGDSSTASGAESSESTDGGEGTTGIEDEGPGIDVHCGGQGGADPDDGVICFYDVESMNEGPAANLEYQLVDLDGQEAIYIELAFAPWFADNTYGDTAIGWPDGHDFDQLVGSDHANLVMRNAEGEVVLDFELDYVEADDTAPSGFRSQGVWKKNGKMNVGEPSAILAATSSLSRNLNERGHDQYTSDSPMTDASYTPNPAAPDWDFRVVYEVWVDASLFTEDGIEACLLSIHASPSKLGENTMEVVPDECPPGWGCFREDGCDECEVHSDPDMGGTCDPTTPPPPVP